MKAVPHTILLTGRSQAQLHSIKSTLASAGYSVEVQSSTSECLDYIRSGKVPAVIVFDIVSPDSETFDEIAIIRKSYAYDELPIVIVSELEDPTRIAGALSAGANDIIAKPLARATFLGRIYNQVRISAARRVANEQQEAVGGLLKIHDAIGDMMLEGLLVHQLDGRTMYANRHLLEMCDGKVPESVDAALDNLLSPQQVEEVLCLWGESVASGENSFEHEFRSVDGPVKSVVVRSRSVEVDGGETLRIWSFQDGVDLRLLNQTTDLHVQLDSVGKFFQGTAHNFNNIFSGIIGASNLLRRLTVENRRAEACLNAIDRSVEVGARLIEKINNMVDTELLGDDSEPQQIHDLLHVLVDAAQLSSGDRVSFVLETDEYLPPVPLGMKSLVEIFGNLLSNAVEAIPGSGVVKIAATHDTDTGKVNVMVQDSCLNMPDIAQIVEREPRRSVQVSGVTSERRGKGMWNVYNLIRSHGGSITLFSEEGGGSSVNVSLPANEEEFDIHGGGRTPSH